jgi:hypothetical protein
MIRRLTSLILGVPDTRGKGRRLKFAIFGGTAVFVAVVTVAVLWLLAKQEKTARQAATRSPRRSSTTTPAPPQRAPAASSPACGPIFGPVTSASVIGAHNEHINTGDSADTRSFFRR